MVCIGELNKEITIQEITETTDSGGGFTSTWGNLSTDPTVWAKVINFPNIKNPTGRDRYVQDQVQNHQTYKFIVRHRSDIQPEMRIVYNGDNYNIRTILPDENHGQYMEIFAEKGVAT